MTCPTCRSRDVLEIRLQLHAEKVTMHSCPACESRWWDRDGENVGLRSVLDLVAAHRQSLRPGLAARLATWSPVAGPGPGC